MSRIKSRLEKVNINLKTIEGKLKAFGEITIGFECPKCGGYCTPILKYNGESPSMERECEFCKEKYLASTEIRIIKEVEDREGIELYRKIKQVTDKIKR